MRYPASEKLEIIGLVERSHLPVKRTLDMLGIPRTTFYRWYDRYLSFGAAGLEDRSSRPGRVWNRIPDKVRKQVVELVLDEPELSPRELAVQFTDTERYFVSEASVYRLLKTQNLITSPTYITIKATDAFCDKTVRPNQLWQTAFTYLEVTGWGWFHLSTILDDYSLIGGSRWTGRRSRSHWRVPRSPASRSGISRPCWCMGVEQRFGVAYHERHFGRLLKELGFSHMSARPRHPAQDGEIIDAYKKIPAHAERPSDRSAAWQAGRDLVPGRSKDRAEERPCAAMGASRHTTPPAG